MDIFKPDQGVLSSQKIEVINGKVAVQLPEFIDDIAVHLYQGTPLTSVPTSETQPNYLFYGITALIVGGLITTVLTIFRG